MNFNDALRFTEILLALAFIQQSIEHLRPLTDISSLINRVFLFRLILSITLVTGFQIPWVLLLLFISSILLLHYFQGPYNGGSDRMSLLILTCLCLVTISPTQYWREVAFGYLALQLVLSYFISGWVKLVNPEWRTGQALRDVFQFSIYPVSKSLRQFSNSPRLLFLMSWGVLVFELLFPFSLLSQTSLIIALSIAALFHFTNACLFGLNRFFWIWLAAYPSLLWLQLRVIPTQ